MTATGALAHSAKSSGAKDRGSDHLGTKITTLKICGCGREFSRWSSQCDRCAWSHLPDEVKRRRAKAKRLMRNVRIAENGGRLTRKELRAIRESGPCQYCGAKATETDHVHALANGGRHEPSNVIPVCQHCSRSKGAKDILSWHRWDLVARALAMNVPAVQQELARLSAQAPADHLAGRDIP